MTELTIENGIIIDDAESVLRSIRIMTGMHISDLEVVKKFINREKNTKFYVDNSLNSSVQCLSNCVYIWLDSGCQDLNGKPVLISLRKENEEYRGHVVGTIRTLAESARNYYKISQNTANKKISTFMQKYSSKISDREHACIKDEQEYLLSCCNEDTTESDFAKKLFALRIDFVPEAVEEITAAETEKIDNDCFSEAEEEITISLLLEKMESMQNDLNEALTMLKNVNQESQAKIQELQEKNDEYKRAILQMRTFVSEEEEKTTSNAGRDENGGHSLLGNRSKILVIGGTELGVNVMRGIAKTYGFEKNDFEFVDYDKSKGFMDRIRKDGKYSAVIVGACPHKTTATAGYSSAVGKLQQSEGMPYTIDARSKSGTLKVTKESFRQALVGVCMNLRAACA